MARTTLDSQEGLDPGLRKKLLSNMLSIRKNWPTEGLPAILHVAYRVVFNGSDDSENKSSHNQDELPLENPFDLDNICTAIFGQPHLEARSRLQDRLLVQPYISSPPLSPATTVPKIQKKAPKRKHQRKISLSSSRKISTRKSNTVSFPPTEVVDINIDAANALLSLKQFPSQSGTGHSLAIQRLFDFE